MRGAEGFLANTKVTDLLSLSPHTVTVNDCMQHATTCGVILPIYSHSPSDRVPLGCCPKGGGHTHMAKLALRPASDNPLFRTSERGRVSIRTGRCTT